MTTIQDLGRTGVNFYAIPASGVMDVSAAKMANLIAGNNPSDALIECSLVGPTILFNAPTTIALTGAHMKWQLNNLAVERNTSIEINSGDILKGAYATEGLRAYIAIRGRIKSDRHYDSCSSYSYAGLGYSQGAPLAKDHILEWLPSGNAPIHIALTIPTKKQKILIHPGPEYDLLSEASKKLLHSASFSVSSESNRMGARLVGPELLASSQLDHSVPTLPGFIQLLPSGQLIVLLKDGQTTGGYPRVAYITSEELDHFNQLPFNRSFMFSLGA